MKTFVAAAALMFAVSACASEPVEAEAKNALTAEQQLAYEKCLQDNMAVAMAWEIIEAQCLEDAQGEARIDPLQVKG